jgi:hypothetical protein
MAILMLWGSPAHAQSFRVQCPSSTITHPDPTGSGVNNSEPAYGGATTYSTPNTTSATGTTVPNYVLPASNINGAIKCQQISGGDGYSTMADGTQTFMFSFGPLSGIADIAAGKPGTENPATFMQTYQSYANSTGTPVPGDPATTDGGSDVTGAYVQGNGGQQGVATNAPIPGASFTYNGAIGLAPDIPNLFTVYDISEGVTAAAASCLSATYNKHTGNPASYVVTVVSNEPLTLSPGQVLNINGTGVTGYDGPQTICATNVPNAIFAANFAFQFVSTNAGLADVNDSSTATASLPAQIDGHVDPRQIMDVGVMNGNIPAPLMAIDEDDEFFLTLTNVGMIMRPDLFEQHTVHFHGYPNASSFYDGVPDASVAINIGGSFTYYYLAPDAGTYFWHCHITPPEHLQMGMVGQIYVRPRQNRAAQGADLYAILAYQNGVNTDPTKQTVAPPATQPVDLRTACRPSVDILCATNQPAVYTGKTQGLNASGNPQMYTYNDGDGSTAYDVEYPIQMHGFDPNFHFVGMTFNPEGFVDMKDKYFLLNGRSYPDTVSPGPQLTQSSDGRVHYSQPLNSIINIPFGGKALIRLSQLSVSEYHTLASIGIPMHVVGYNAKLLRDQDGNNMDYYTNSVTLGGGESLDFILDASNTGLYSIGQKFFIYSSNLDHLSNDAENFGGEMTEVNICRTVDPVTKACGS